MIYIPNIPSHFHISDPNLLQFLITFFIWLKYLCQYLCHLVLIWLMTLNYFRNWPNKYFTLYEIILGAAAKISIIFPKQCYISPHEPWYWSYISDSQFIQFWQMFYLLHLKWHFWCSTSHLMKSAQHYLYNSGIKVDILDTCGAMICS